MARKLTAFSTTGNAPAGGGYYHLPITDIVITKRDGQKVRLSRATSVASKAPRLRWLGPSGAFGI